MRLKFIDSYIKITFLIAASFCLSLSVMAQGTLTWGWTWSGSWWTGGGTLVTANVLSTDPVGAAGNSPFTGYQVLGITGTFTNYPNGVGGNGVASSIVAVLSLDATNSFFGSGDNLLSPSGIHVDVKGLDFSVTGDHWSMTSGGVAYGIQSASGGGDSFDYFGQGFTLTPLPAPEPSTVALTMLGALSGVSLMRRRTSLFSK